MYFVPLIASLSMLMVLLGLYNIIFQQQYDASNFFVTILFAVIFGLSVVGMRTKKLENLIPIGT